MMRTLQSAKPERPLVSLESLHERGRISPALSLGSVLVGLVLLVGCSAPGEVSGHDDAAHEGSEATAAPVSEPPSGRSTSGEGLIDVEGGYTQDEQLAELGIVVDIMREHFGEDVATIDGEPWTAERHDAEVAARP